MGMAVAQIAVPILLTNQHIIAETAVKRWIGAENEHRKREKRYKIFKGF
jgi:hypothetical protein